MDKERIHKSLKLWLTCTAREQECHDDEVACVAYDYLKDMIE